VRIANEWKVKWTGQKLMILKNMVEWYCKFVSHSIVFLYFSLNIDIVKVHKISILFKEVNYLRKEHTNQFEIQRYNCISSEVLMRFPPQIFSIYFCSLHTFCGFRYNPLTLFLFCWLLKYQLTDGMSCSRLLRMNPLVSESGNGKVAVEWIRIDCILVAGTRYSFCRFFTYFLLGAATPAVS